MARVAVVTGGTRGIGAEVSRALHDAGYKIVANYNRNVEGAKRFNAETGIAIQAWDVSDYGQCEANLAQIAAEGQALLKATRRALLAQYDRESSD